VASANARCTSRRCVGEDARYTAERTSGWRSATPASRSSRPSASAARCRRLGDPEPLSRSPDQRRIADRVSGRHEQQASRLRWQPRQSPSEAFLDAVGEGQCGGQTEPTRQLRGRQPARQLQQGERIPACLGDDALAHALVEPIRQDRVQQRPRIAIPQALDRELRESRWRVARLAHREHDRDPLRQQPARHERERARRRTIEPLRVVDDAQEGLLLGSFGQHAEDGQSDEEAIRGLARSEPERDGKRLALRVW
jgi:hypothetical protein